nr:hypothetical protein [Catenulispora acidiphila]
MPVKLPGPVVGTAEQALPNAAVLPAAVLVSEEVVALVEPAAGVVLDAMLEEEVLEAAAVLLALLLHALALTAIAAEHSRAAAVLLRVENIFSSLIRCSGCVWVLLTIGIRGWGRSGLVNVFQDFDDRRGLIPGSVRSR